MFGFKEYPFFQVPPEAKQVPKVDFKKSTDRPAAVGTAALEQPSMAARAAARRRAVPAHRLPSASRHPAQAIDELALDDVGDIQRTRVDAPIASSARPPSSSTPRRRGAPPIVLTAVRRGAPARRAARTARRRSARAARSRRGPLPRSPGSRDSRRSRCARRSPGSSPSSSRHLRRRDRPARQDRGDHLPRPTMRSRRMARSGATRRSCGSWRRGDAVGARRRSGASRAAPIT